ncbi:FAD/NAD P-binding domain-containing protein [Mycena venus]|uniref:FAD/NAD P-binding domain-containing protein n=1 Tax=Mycena venus TaxID=2733690 RepID=A0A8H6YL50_9AGAR|nr:FAD/NAD P-binding domain-containing protein [Mycena venus]
MRDSSVPSSSTGILVIGGGPGGAYAAAALAREGFQVTVLEKDYFPRYHIGESLLASCRALLRFIDAEAKIDDFGFALKVGAAVKLNQEKREGYIPFKPTAWNVLRSEFDQILLQHAAESGASVHEGISVQAIKFSSENPDPDKPIAAEWKSKDGMTGKIDFSWLVDASGRNGIMSTKYLKNRKFNHSLKNVAVWGYWSGANVYSEGTDRENAPWFEGLTDETGWAWFIPLHNGTVSVGIVQSETSSRAKKSKLSGVDSTMEAHYHSQIQLAPGVFNLLGNAHFLGDLKSAADYSYSASQYAGTNYRIVGDAGAFIDPFFSSGVHLAFSGALEAILVHNERTSVSYTRFLLVVLAIYKQINSQASAILSDVNEDNFDRAFDFLRPIVQGAADTDPSVTDVVVQRTIDFLAPAFGTTRPELLEKVSKRLDPSLLASDGDILAPNAVNAIAGNDDEANRVLRMVNSRKAMHFISDWETCQMEKSNGFAVVLKRGELGLQREDAEKQVAMACD